MTAITAFLEQRLKLKVNAAKSAVARPWQRKFLGYSMTWHKKPKLKIAQQSRERFAEKFRKALREARGGSLKHAVERLKPILRGWVAYFRFTEVKGVTRTTRWLDQTQAAGTALAAMEAQSHASEKPDAGWAE